MNINIIRRIKYLIMRGRMSMEKLEGEGNNMKTKEGLNYAGDISE